MSRRSSQGPSERRARPVRRWTAWTAYASGELPAAEFARLTEKFGAEAKAAQQAVEQHRLRVRQIDDATNFGDAEEETLRRLAQLVDVATGDVRDAETTDAMRSALRQVYAG